MTGPWFRVPSWIGGRLTGDHAATDAEAWVDLLGRWHQGEDISICAFQKVAKWGKSRAIAFFPKVAAWAIESGAAMPDGWREKMSRPESDRHADRNQTAMQTDSIELEPASYVSVRPESDRHADRNQTASCARVPFKRSEEIEIRSDSLSEEYPRLKNTDSKYVPVSQKRPIDTTAGQSGQVVPAEANEKPDGQRADAFECGEADQPMQAEATALSMAPPVGPHPQSLEIPADQEWEMDPEPFEIFDTPLPAPKADRPVAPIVPPDQISAPPCSVPPPIPATAPTDHEAAPPLPVVATPEQAAPGGVYAGLTGPQCAALMAERRRLRMAGLLPSTPPAARLARSLAAVASPPAPMPAPPLPVSMLPEGLDLLNLLTSGPEGKHGHPIARASTWILALSALGIETPQQLENTTFDTLKFSKGIGAAVAQTLSRQMVAWGSSLAPDPAARILELIQLSGRYSQPPADVVTARDRRWLKAAGLAWQDLGRSTLFEVGSLKQRFVSAAQGAA